MCKPLRGWLAGKEVSGPEGPCIRQPGPFYGPAALAGAGHGPAALDELCTVVEDEGTTLNQFVSVAVAEKLAALRTERCFQARGRPRRPGGFSDHPGEGRERDRDCRRQTAAGIVFS